MRALGAAAADEGVVYLTGGATAVIDATAFRRRVEGMPV
jgi:hypothetical protein